MTSNRLFFGIVFLFLLMMIPHAEAIEINELNDTSTSKNLTYVSPGSKTEYISIYRYANVSKAEWNLTGIVTKVQIGENDTEHDWSFSGEVCSTWPPITTTVDEDWETGTCIYNISNLYENYTLTSSDYVNWTFKIKNTAGIYNEKIFCWNTTDWEIIHNIELVLPEAVITVEVPANCISGTYLQIRSGIDVDYQSFEYWEGKAVFINGTYVENITIDTGNDEINDYTNTTEFKTSERIDLNITAILNYLETCSSNPCDVPFNISSESSGIMQISDIEIVYEEYDAITNCSGDNDATSLMFEHFHEESLDEINASLDITFEATVYGNQSNNYSFAFSENHSHAICISPAWMSYTSDAFGVYYSGTHSQRSYYLVNGTLSNSTQTVNLYSLNATDSDAVVVYVKDADGLFVEDVYIKIQRYYPGTGTYNTIAYMNTDEDGKDMTYLYLNDVYYKFILEQNGVVVNEISPRTITNTVDDPEELTLSLVGEGIEYFQIEDINYGCAWNNATFTLRCTVSDSSNLMVESCLKTDKLGILSPETVNETCDTDSAVTHIHVIGNNTGNYKYVLTISTATNDYNVITATINIPGPGSDFDDWGLMVSFLIIMVCGLLGMTYPPAGGILAVAGLIISLSINMIDIAGASVIGLLIVAFIYLWKGRK